MLTKQVWKPVLWDYLTDEERRSTISSSMFLKEKFTADGKFDKLRARLVAGGHQQDRSVYSDSETSSRTVSTTSLFVIAAIAARENRKVVTIDFNKYVNDVQISICMYVDDLFVTCYDSNILDATILEIDTMFQGCTLHRGTIHSYLGDF